MHACIRLVHITYIIYDKSNPQQTHRTFTYLYVYGWRFRRNGACVHECVEEETES